MTTSKKQHITPMNQWVLDLIATTNLTGAAAAEILTTAIGAGYNRFTLYKMTRGRKVSMTEAQALSRATGFPLPTDSSEELSYDQRRAQLSQRHRDLIDSILAEFEAQEAKEREDGQ